MKINMEENKIKQIFNKYINQVPDFISVYNQFIWVDGDYRVVVVKKLEGYNLIIYKFESNNLVKLLTEYIKFTDREKCEVELKLLNIKENYYNKVFEDLSGSKNVDPRDELLEDIKDDE